MGVACDRARRHDGDLRLLAALASTFARRGIPARAFRVVTALSWIALICAGFPAALFVWNLQLFKPPRGEDRSAAVSILIPARDEERNIGAAIRAALANEGAEVVVL